MSFVPDSQFRISPAVMALVWLCVPIAWAVLGIALIYRVLA